MYPEHHYKKIVIIVGILLGLVVVAGIVYFIMTKRSDQRMRDDYASGQIETAKQLMGSFSQKPTTMTDADKKALQGLLAGSGGNYSSTDAEMRELFRLQAQLAADSFVHWQKSQ